MTEIRSNAEVWDVFGHSGLLGIMLMALAVLMATFVYCRRDTQSRTWWKWIENHLYIGFAFCWLFGFAVYATGMLVATGLDTNSGRLSADLMLRLLCVAPMAVVHAFGMFGLQSDVSEVHSALTDNLLYMTLFSAAHFCAACVSTLFVIKHFGYNVISNLHLWGTSQFGGGREELFVFWGTNEPSFHLAMDIKQHSRVAARSRTVIVRTTDRLDEDDSRTTLERFFNFFSVRNHELEKLRKLECFTAHSFRRLSRLEFEAGAERGEKPVKVLQDRLNLPSLARLVNKTESHVHIFFLGDSEQDNVRAVCNILKDSSLLEYAQEHHVTVYCHAHYDSVNRVAENWSASGNVEVQIVDPSHESINLLKENVDWHPVRCLGKINTESNPGTTDDLFCSLVVGFGQTGRDALRFLYEYGTFVDQSSTMDNVKRSGFLCHVVDEKMDADADAFFVQAPALQRVHNRCVEGICIETHQTYAGSDDYYKVLSGICRQLNYVVVALGDDERNISTAVDLYEFIRRRRAEDELRRLRIFVVCKSDAMEPYVRRIADFYNQANSHRAKIAANGEAEMPPSPIVVVGTIGQLYTYERIVGQQFVQRGRAYNETYCKVSGNEGKKDVWNTRRSYWTEEGGLDGFSRLRRQEGQDVSNAYHALTKMSIMDYVTRERPDMIHLRAALDHHQEAPTFERRLTERNQPVGDKTGVMKGNDIVVRGDFSKAEQRLLHNLARMEHLRWNAAHELMGYVPYDYKAYPDAKGLVGEASAHQCNEQYRLHNCLIPWKDLDKESVAASSSAYSPDYKLFDYCVITTSIRLH